MRRLVACLVVFLGALSGGTHCAFGAQTRNEISDYRKYVYAWLLTAHDSGRIKLGAKGLEYDGNKDRDLDDMAAKVLWESLQGRRDLDADTRAWLIRGLGASASNRYKNLLEAVADDAPGKVANYAKDNIKSLTHDDESFDASAVQLDQIRAALKVSAEEMLAPEQALLLNLRPGAWLDDVLDTLGYPHDVSVAIQSIRRPFVGRIHITNLALHYYDQGTIEFSHDRGDWYAIAVTPQRIRPVAANGASVNPEWLAKSFVSSDPNLLRSTAMQTYRGGPTELAVLDAAAWRLRADMNSSDRQVIDALSYICLTLGNARMPRYRDLLVLVGKNAKEGKLRRHAQGALKLTPTTEAEQFTGEIPPRQM